MSCSRIQRVRLEPLGPLVSAAVAMISATWYDLNFKLQSKFLAEQVVWQMIVSYP